jgi:heme oxygenase (mycobilin-producing)
MSVVKINALHVPAGQGGELEGRFAARARMVDGEPGFEGFTLLRPVKGEDRYFVMTVWESQESFDAWRAKTADHGPVSDGRKPVATGADLLEFEVVDLP